MFRKYKIWKMFSGDVVTSEAELKEYLFIDSYIEMLLSLDYDLTEDNIIFKYTENDNQVVMVVLKNSGLLLF